MISWPASGACETSSNGGKRSARSRFKVRRVETSFWTCVEVGSYNSTRLFTSSRSRLREEVNNRVELYDPTSTQVQKLVSTLRTLNLDLADLFPPLLDVSQAPEAGQEIITQLRLLHSTVGVKLDQFDRAPHRGVLADRKFR